MRLGEVGQELFGETSARRIVRNHLSELGGMGGDGAALGQDGGGHRHWRMVFRSYSSLLNRPDSSVVPMAPFQ
jgi:hypothetical protein